MNLGKYGWKPTQEKKIEIPVYVKDIKIVIQNLSKNKTLAQMALVMNFIKYIKRNCYYPNFFQKIEKGLFLNSFVEARIT